MSKIAEKKVMELGYGTDPLRRNEYSANDVFDAAVECYDQAMQDFLEKAEKWFNDVFIDDAHDSGRGFLTKIVTYDFDNIQELIEQFKNYMQNESEK